MNIPPEPEDFRELCEKIGLALMLSQKVQFALAHYFATYHIVKNNWTRSQANESIEKHLSKPMGTVISNIEKSAPLDSDLAKKVRDFKNARNWLAHDFDQEATPYLSQDKKFAEYIAKMNEIVTQASDLMFELHEVGEVLIPVGSKISRVGRVNAA